jgi:hypothetical protein
MKEVKFNDLSANIKISIVIIILLLAISFILIINNKQHIENELKQVPHKVCVNESGNYVFAPEEFRLLNRDDILGVNDCKFNYYLNNTICSQPFKREVCKWVDAEGNELK